jgi:hypothetical protein
MRCLTFENPKNQIQLMRKNKLVKAINELKQLEISPEVLHVEDQEAAILDSRYREFNYSGFIINEFNQLGRYREGTYNKIVDSTEFLFDSVVITTKGRNYPYSERASKLLMYGLMDVIKKNDQKNIESVSKLNRTSEFSVRKYVYDQGLKDEKWNRNRASKEISCDLNLLMPLNVNLLESAFRKPIDYRYFDKFNLIERFTIKNGNVHMLFTETFVKYLTDTKLAHIMEFPKRVFKLSPRAFILAYKFYLKKNMDGLKFCRKYRKTKKISEIILSTETIMKALGSIPKYEDLKYKKLSEKIKDPIERLLDEIKEKGIFLNWEYCRAKGASLSDDNLDLKTYNIFKELYIKVTSLL